tara:strand:- start:334 stop:1554 length:1221 start_codon:yes stop_codon:yes gene_type:complete
MKMRKAWVHIGTEKTGTTTIQKFFDKNRELLVSQGYHFMRSTGIANDARLAGYCLASDQLNFYLFRNEFIDTEEKKDLYDKQFVEMFRNEISNLPDEVSDVVFSSEFFHSRLTRKDQREKLKNLLEKYFDSIEIVCYIRPQIDVNISLYSTTLKSGGATLSLSEHLERCHPANYYYDYYRVLSGWEQSFINHNVNYRVFDKRELYSSDVVLDFCAVIGLNSEDLSIISQENESVTPTGQELLRLINKKLPVFIDGVGVNYLRINFVKYISNICSGSGEKPDKQSAISIQEQFDVGNEEVRRKWFPERKSLFVIDYNKYNEQDPVDIRVIEFFELLIEEISKTDTATLLGINSKRVNALRDSALLLEDNNIDLSLSLMSFALLLRPNGAMIKKKVSEYRDALSGPKL